jgi:GT2 family glycosyltransferase
MNGKNLFFTSSNCSLPRIIFHQLHGFDERLADVEDYDLAFRALKKNIKVYFDKSNKAIHQDSITCLSYIKRLRQYTDAKQQWSKIHSNEAPRSTRSRFKKLLYLPLASHYWMMAIDKNLFIYFPMKIRYKLYDLVIQALAIEFPKTKLV